MAGKKPVGMEKKGNNPQLCSRCRRETVDYEVIARRGSGKQVLCRACIRKGL